MVQVKAWVLVQARRNNYGTKNKHGQLPVSALRAVKLTAACPDVPVDHEAVEIIIDFPDDYFDTSHPQVVVQVPQPAPKAAAVIAKVKAKGPSAAAAIVNGGN